MQRRKFVSSALFASAASATVTQAAGANDRIRVGVVGSGGRAASLIRTFAANPDADVAALADIDSRKLPAAVGIVREEQNSTPRTVKDFRELIDDPTLDAIVVGTPDHWHAIPTILACQAGKDVYVEKPDAHNIIEGRRMVAAMKKHGRIVQMGSQHRSTRRLQSAIDYVRSGALGRCLVAKAWESTRQGSIGFPPDGVPPPEVDYDMWLGSAPKRPFNPRRFHGHWRWFYDYGTGDLGNDGVHRLDMAVALLNAACDAQGDDRVGLPRRISACGGKRYFDDMQQFPDTMQATWEYAGPIPKILTYEMRVWAPYQMNGEGEGACLYGDKGYIVVGNNRWRAYNRDGLVKEEKGDAHERPHVSNFLECMRTRKKPYCDLETVGHPASVVCHTGNISARLGRDLTLNSNDETFVDDDDANALRGRSEWRAPYELPEV